MHRRTFVRSAFAAALAALAALAAALPALAKPSRPPRILLRNAWQSFNIGDVAHPLGMLALLERSLPDASVHLWPTDVGNGVAELLAKRYPKLVILNDVQAIDAAFKSCDFFLHGSGSGLVAKNDVARWRKETGKPYGVYGISLTTAAPPVIELLGGAAFAFFRESASLKLAQDAGCACPVMAFGPDSAFAVTDLRDDAAADAFLKASGLEAGKFLCCIPRYRWTPIWTVKKTRPFDAAKDRRNQEIKEHDHAPLREAITAVVRQTAMKVLVCCEDVTQVELGKAMLVDPLPADVKARVVWRDKFWLTDEALSTYARSAGLFGNEMHSPILCVANGIPAVVCRWKEQTSKGLMWRDIGLDEWLFDLDDDDDVRRVAPAVLAIAKDPAAAKAKAAKALEIVRHRQQETMGVLARTLG